MKTDKLSIGFIGAGQIGGTLIRQYTKAGHTVKMANASGIEKLKSLAAETGATAVTLADAVTGVDVLVLSIIAASLILSGTPSGTDSRIALPVSGDDKEAKTLVSALVETSGFDSFDAGSLIDSWRQQPGSPVYCTDLTITQLKKSIGKARKEILPERRELGLAFILQQDPERWMDCIKHNRVIYESELAV